MIRRLYSIATTISLALFLAATALWLRSQWVEDVWRYQASSGSEDVSYSRGCDGGFLWAERDVYSGSRYSLTPGLQFKSLTGSDRILAQQNLWTSHDNHAQPNALGFWFGDIPGTTDEVVIVPIYLFILLGAILPLLWLGGIRPQARWPANARGRCAVCGYDLRGTPGLCPECGAVPPIVGLPAGGESVQNAKDVEPRMRADAHR